jgi:hypothetical protein
MSVDPIRSLPKEMSLEIFSNLGLVDLARSSQVSSDWNNFINNDLWKFLSKKIFINSLPELSALPKLRAQPELRIEFFHEFASQLVRSNDELLGRIWRLVCKINLGKNGRFSCVFIDDNSYTKPIVSIEIKGNSSNDSFNFQEDCFSLGQLRSDITIPPQVSSLFSNPSLVIDSRSGRRSSITTFKIRGNNGSFQAILGFPKFAPDEDRIIILHARIKSCVIAGLQGIVAEEICTNRLVNQAQHQNVLVFQDQNPNFVMHCTAAAIVLLFAYALDLYLNVANSDK